MLRSGDHGPRRAMMLIERVGKLHVVRNLKWGPELAGFE